MNPPSVSIVMPTYNRAYIVGSAIESVLAQTNPNWELVIVDDGSTDDPAKVVVGYHDARIKLFKQPHTGLSSTRNYALRQCAGQWITYLDTDNELMPDFVEVMLAQFESLSSASYGMPKAHYTL